jgi:hypothetical protein
MTRRGDTPLSLAVKNGHDECVEWSCWRCVVCGCMKVIRPSIESHRAHPLSSPLCTHAKEWECLYLISKARRLRDATATLHLIQTSSSSVTTANTHAPAFLAERVGRGAALPKVEVEGVQAEGGGEWEGANEKEMVVRHVVEGMRGDFARELLGMLDL